MVECILTIFICPFLCFYGFFFVDVGSTLCLEQKMLLILRKVRVELTRVPKGGSPCHERCMACGQI